MPFPPNNLAEFLSGADAAALQEAFDTPVQVETSWREQSLEAIPWIGGAVLPAPDDRFANALYRLEHFKNNPPLQQGNDPFQSKPRPPDEKEKEALIFTFGETMGNHLINIIEIGQAGVGSEGKIRMVLPSGYDSNNLDLLATFIYEATRVWQIDVGQFLEDRNEDNYDYTYKDLYELELTSTQHAEAVKDWFYVNYGIETGEVSFAKDQIKFEGLWKKTLTVLGLTRLQRFKFGDEHLGGQEGTLQQTVNNHYACVILGIRNVLGRSYPYGG